MNKTVPEKRKKQKKKKKEKEVFKQNIANTSQ